MKDKGFIKNAIFLSYTSLSDFLKCPNSYYLKNLYRNPATGNRLQVASPYISLGATVHDAIEWYLKMQGQVAYEQLELKFRNFWLKFRGKRGGFESNEQEGDFGRRGLKMLKNFYHNAYQLEKEVLEIVFPKMNLFDNVVLIGNFDFVGVQDDGKLHIIDFKTGANEQKDILQLEIYKILAEECFEREVSKIGYWYLDRDQAPVDVDVQDKQNTVKWLTEQGRRLKSAIEQNNWVCIKADQGCRECNLYRAVIDGRGEFQFSDFKYKKDVYFLLGN